MTERLSTATLPAPGEAPAEHSSTTVEHTPEPTSPEERRRVATERVATFLYVRIHERAIEENARFDQDAAYATYAENIEAGERPEVDNNEVSNPDPESSTPETQEREELEGRIKSFFRKLTNAALVRLEASGYIPPRSQWHQMRGGPMSWWLRRRSTAQNRSKRRAVGFSSAEEAAELGLDQDDEPEPDEEVEEDDHKEDSSEDEDNPLETTEDGDETDKKTVREKAKERAKRALERRRQRRESRPSFRERAGERLKKGAMGKIGRGALKLFKRVSKATRAAFSSIRGNSA